MGMPPTNDEPERRARMKEDLVKALHERHDYYQEKARQFKDLGNQASKLEVKSEAVPASPDVQGTDEEVGARYKAWVAATQKNVKILEKFQSAYSSLSKHLEGSDDSPTQDLRGSGEGSARAGEQVRGDEEQQQLEYPVPQPEPEGEWINPLSVSDEEQPAEVSDTSHEQLREIPFDQVYHGGNASRKDFIVEYPEDSNMFYIFRCEECQTFPFAVGHDGTLTAARRHLNSSRHADVKGTGENAFKYLRIRVLNCTKTLANKNNDAFKKWFNKPETQKLKLQSQGRLSAAWRSQVQKKPKARGKTVIRQKPTIRSNVRRKRALTDSEGRGSLRKQASSKRRKAAALDPTDIRAGDVYCSNTSKSVYKNAIVVLPLFEERPEWKQSVLRTPAAMGCWSKDDRQLPADMFEVDPMTNFPTDWAPEYRPTGSHYRNRKYPAVSIEGEKWDVSCTYFDWVALSSIEPYQEEHLREGEIKGVEDYTLKRDAAQRRQHGEKNTQVSDSKASTQSQKTESSDFDVDTSDSEEEQPSTLPNLPALFTSPVSVARQTQVTRSTQAAPRDQGVQSPPLQSRSRNYDASSMTEHDLVGSTGVVSIGNENRCQGQAQLISQTRINSGYLGRRSFGGVLNKPSASAKRSLHTGNSSGEEGDITNSPPSLPPRIESDVPSSRLTPRWPGQKSSSLQMYDPAVPWF